MPRAKGLLPSTARTRMITVVLALCLAVASCTSTGTSGSAPSRGEPGELLGSGEIGPQGGLVGFHGGRLSVPAGAMPASTTARVLVVQSLPDSPPSPYLHRQLRNAVEINLGGVVPSKLLRLELDLDPRTVAGVPAGGLFLAASSDNPSRPSLLPSSQYQSDTHVLAASIQSAGVFAPVIANLEALGAMFGDLVFKQLLGIGVNHPTCVGDSVTLLDGSVDLDRSGHLAGRHRSTALRVRAAQGRSACGRADQQQPPRQLQLSGAVDAPGRSARSAKFVSAGTGRYVSARQQSPGTVSALPHIRLDGRRRGARGATADSSLGTTVLGLVIDCLPGDLPETLKALRGIVSPMGGLVTVSPRAPSRSTLSRPLPLEHPSRAPTGQAILSCVTRRRGRHRTPTGTSGVGCLGGILGQPCVDPNRPANPPAVSRPGWPPSRALDLQVSPRGRDAVLFGFVGFEVEPVAGASGYLWGFFQQETMVWENCRDERRLSDSAYRIRPGTTAHDAIGPGALQVWVRALVNGGWTEAAIRNVTLA